jgi:hypothetical protein
MKRTSVILLILIVVGTLLVVLAVAMSTPAIEPTKTPLPALPGWRLDERTEVLLTLLEQTPTGRLLAEFLRQSSIQVEWVWLTSEADSRFRQVTCSRRL